MENKNIMIVEDDLEVGRMLERAFRFGGYEVDLFHNGKSVLDYLKKSKKHPHAIIMDVIMPEMSGIELLKNIKKEPGLEKIPIMVLTNSFLKEDAEQFLNLGADLYLVKIQHKPIDIVDKINNLIKINNK